MSTYEVMRHFADSYGLAAMVVAYLVLCGWALSLLAATTFVPWSDSTRAILTYADDAICVIFLGDFVYNLATAPKRLTYLATWGWIDLLSSIPAMLVRSACLSTTRQGGARRTRRHPASRRKRPTGPTEGQSAAATTLTASQPGPFRATTTGCIGTEWACAVIRDRGAATRSGCSPRTDHAGQEHI